MRMWRKDSLQILINSIADRPERKLVQYDQTGQHRLEELNLRIERSMVFRNVLINNYSFLVIFLKIDRLKKEICVWSVVFRAWEANEKRMNLRENGIREEDTRRFVCWLSAPVFIKNARRRANNWVALIGNSRWFTVIRFGIIKDFCAKVLETSLSFPSRPLVLLSLITSLCVSSSQHSLPFTTNWWSNLGGLAGGTPNAKRFFLLLLLLERGFSLLSLSLSVQW